MNAPETFPTPVSEQAVELVPIGRPIVVREYFKPKLDRDRPFPEASEYRPPREIPLQNRCSLHCLPQSLLASIFRKYLRDDGGGEHRTKDLTHKPEFLESDHKKHLHAVHANHKPALTSNLSSSARQFTLFAVCKYWRSFYHHQPLWASLAVYKPRMAQLPMISFWLERSVGASARGTVPISLYLYAPLEDEGYDSQAVEAILSIFLDPKNTRRMRKLTLKVAGLRSSYKFPRALDAPILQSLELDFGTSKIPLCLIHFVYLRQTTLRTFYWCPVLTESLSLGIRPWDLLTHIKFPLLDLKYDRGNTFLWSLLTVLIYCENLYSLEITLAAPPRSHSEFPLPRIRPSRQERTQNFLRERGPFEMFSKVSRDMTTVALRHPVVLPRLVHFKFEAFGREADPLLFYIEAPKLGSLEIIHHKGGVRLPTGILAMLHPACPPLTCLTIYDLNMSKQTVARLLAFSIPTLLSLELCVAPVGNRVMRALTITRRDRHPMPNIRKLVLPECTVSNGHLVDMVMSRIPVLQMLRLSLPTTIKTGPKRQTVPKKQYKELRHLREMTRHLSEAQFSLTVD